MKICRLAPIVLTALLTSSPLFAQEAPVKDVAATAQPEIVAPDASRYVTKDGAINARLLNTPLFVIGQPQLRRPAALPLLYIGFIALEVLDGVSTSRGISVGTQEANPFVRLAVEHPSTLWAVKAGAAAGVIIASEQLWKHHHRTQAIAVMVASSTVMAAVAAQNSSAINRTRD